MKPGSWLLLVIACLGGGPAPAPGQVGYRGGVISPPVPKPKFVLTDTSGAPFDFQRNTQGYVTLLFFGYTYCPDQCPMHMGTLGAALKTLPAGGCRPGEARVRLRPTPHAIPPRFCGDGWICSTAASSASREPKLRLKRSSALAGVPLATRTPIANGNYGCRARELRSGVHEGQPGALDLSRRRQQTGLGARPAAAGQSELVTSISLKEIRKLPSDRL